MEGKQLTYKWRLRMIIIILAAGVIIKCMGPLAFVRDGLLTRMRVDDYLMQWDMGATRRHEAGIKDVYLVYFGFEEVYPRAGEESACGGVLLYPGMGGERRDVGIGCSPASAGDADCGRVSCGYVVHWGEGYVVCVQYPAG